MKKKHACLIGLIIVLVVAMSFLLPQVPQPVTEEKWEVVVDLITPYGSYLENNPNFASIAFFELDDPQRKLDEILGNWGETGQYWTYDLIDNGQENKRQTYCYTIYGLSDNWLIEHDIPPIHQDNENIRFCFYTRWGVNYISEPIVFSMTVILPADYEVENVQCSDPYVTTSEDNQAKVMVENASMDRDFEVFTLRIDYRKLLPAYFTYSPVSPIAEETVYFTDQSSAENIASWSWDFGDGSTSTDQNPAHTFTSGTYTITLTITTSGGQISTHTTTIVVFGLPLPNTPIFNDAGLLPEEGLIVGTIVWPKEGEWGLTAPYVDSNYSDVVGIPEGVECWYTRNGPEENTYAGWGVFIGVDPSTNEINPAATHIIDLSGVSTLEFYVKSPVNLHVELQEWNTTTDNKGAKSNQLWIGNYGWENTGGWEKITIPKSEFRNVNFTKIWCPFMISTPGSQPNVGWYIDRVVWKVG